MATSAELHERRAAAVPRGVSNATAIYAKRAKNAEIWSEDGKRYVDFGAGIAVVNTGHQHPKIVAAVEEQLMAFSHVCFQVTPYESYVRLAERLNALAPVKGPAKTMLVSTGAEAVENAVKVARAFTGRPGIVSFSGGFHGRTLMGMALTGKVAPYKAGFGPFPAEIYHARYPNPLHGVSEADALASIEHIFKSDVEPERVAAIILEPVQGEGGFYAASPSFAQALRTLCDKHGILLIADEVQTGAGRTGTWLACEQWGVAPDLVTMAKSMAGGFPIAAVIGRASAMDAAPAGGLGSTYAGHPLACAAALAVLKVFDEEKLLDRAKAVGARLAAGLGELAKRHAAIKDVRAHGAMVAIEMFKNGDLHQPDADLTKRVCAEALKRGLILLSCGVYGNVIRILVPLTVPDQQIDEALAILGQSFDAAQG